MVLSTVKCFEVQGCMEQCMHLIMYRNSKTIDKCIVQEKYTSLLLEL